MRTSTRSARISSWTSGSTRAAAGTPAPDADALAAQATAPDTERPARRSYRAPSASTRSARPSNALLTAYDMDLPPRGEGAAPSSGGQRLSATCLSWRRPRTTISRPWQPPGRPAGQARLKPTALGNLGLVYADRGDLDKAEEHYQRGAGHRRGDGQQARPGQAARQPGHRLRIGAASWTRPRSTTGRALAIHEEIGNKLGQANDLGNLGNVYARRGDLDKAEEHLQEGAGASTRRSATPSVNPSVIRWQSSSLYCALSALICGYSGVVLVATTLLAAFLHRMLNGLTDGVVRGRHPLIRSSIR